jgi:hypothetical protein
MIAASAPGESGYRPFARPAFATDFICPRFGVNQEVTRVASLLAATLGRN